MKNKERLYLITDSSSLESLIEKSFKTYGFIVRTDSDTGQFADNIIEFGPDVIVIDSDINQFNIDGICSSIEKDEKLTDIPVILMTHIEDEEMISTALSRCIYDYVYKPVEPNILHSRIRVILSMKAKFREIVEQERHSYVKATAARLHHEINQPLSVILLSTEMLETKVTGRLKENEQKYITKIKRAINSIIDILYRLSLVTEDDYRPEIIDTAVDSSMLKLPASDFKNKVLVVDDLDDVRESVAEIISNEGIDVFAAKSIEEAMDIIDREHQNITTVYCDMKIGDRTGMELYHYISKKKSSMRFVIITGYPIKGKSKQSIRELSIPVIMKPFTRRRILKELNNH